MKNRLVIRSVLAITMGMAIAGCASADRGYRHHYHEDRAYVNYEADSYQDYGVVLDARPIYQRVAVDVPRESCSVQTVSHEERRRGGGDSFGGTVLGGLVGAAIGHELGNGRGAATAAGGMIGATIGNNASGGSRETHYRDEEVCNTLYRTQYEQRIVGYDVSYSYDGRIYQTRTDHHPGDRIAVAVDVRPGY